MKVLVEEFIEQLWDIVLLSYRDPILMGTGLDKEAREELLSKCFMSGRKDRTLHLSHFKTAPL